MGVSKRGMSTLGEIFSINARVTSEIAVEFISLIEGVKAVYAEEDGHC